MGTQAFISASGSGCPRPCEPQTELWTLKTEGRTRTVTLLNVRHKQRTYSVYYWFWVTNVFLDDFSGTFLSVYAWFYVLKNVLNF